MLCGCGRATLFGKAFYPQHWLEVVWKRNSQFGQIEKCSLAVSVVSVKWCQNVAVIITLALHGHLVTSSLLGLSHEVWQFRCTELRSWERMQSSFCMQCTRNAWVGNTETVIVNIHCRRIHLFCWGYWLSFIYALLAWQPALGDCKSQTRISGQTSLIFPIKHITMDRTMF